MPAFSHEITYMLFNFAAILKSFLPFLSICIIALYILSFHKYFWAPSLRQAIANSGLRKEDSLLPRSTFRWSWHQASRGASSLSNACSRVHRRDVPDRMLSWEHRGRLLSRLKRVSGKLLSGIRYKLFSLSLSLSLSFFFLPHCTACMILVPQHQGLNPGPSSLSSKESACQHRRHGFDSWVRKIPWRRKWKPTPVSLGNPMDREA